MIFLEFTVVSEKNTSLQTNKGPSSTHPHSPTAPLAAAKRIAGAHTASLLSRCKRGLPRNEQAEQAPKLTSLSLQMSCVGMKRGAGEFELVSPAKKMRQYLQEGYMEYGPTWAEQEFAAGTPSSFPTILTQRGCQVCGGNPPAWESVACR